MPRPRRTKIAPSVPTVGVPTRTNASSIVPKHIVSLHPSSRDSTNSDDSEGLVKKSKAWADRNGSALQDVRMSGALAIEDGGGSTRLRPLSGRERESLLRIVRDADYARKVEPLKRNTKRGTRDGKGKQAESALLSSSMPEAQEHQTIDRAKPNEASVTRVAVLHANRPAPRPDAEAQMTAAAEASVLALARFRKRARQASILQIGHQDDSPLPSYTLDDLVDFNPVDESTPLQTSKIGSTSHIQSPRGPKPPPSSISLPLTATSSHKRKLTAPVVQVPRSQISVRQASSTLSERDSKLDAEDDEIQSSMPEGTQLILPLMREKRVLTSETGSSVFALPQSCSPSQLESDQEHRKDSAWHYQGHSRRADKRRDLPAIQAYQRFTSGQRRARTEPLKSLSTATLQDFLPRRRLRKARHLMGETDILNKSDNEPRLSEPADDHDELTYVSPRARKGGRKDLGGTKWKRSGKIVVDAEMGATSRRRSKFKSRNVSNRAVKGVTQTYSRRTSDKENRPTIRGLESEKDGTDSNSLSATSDNASRDGVKATDIPKRLRTELATLVKKFQEVDEWDLQFEEVTASSSSPLEAR